jgi:hypothetical protein
MIARYVTVDYVAGDVRNLLTVKFGFASSASAGMSP